MRNGNRKDINEVLSLNLFFDYESDEIQKLIAEYKNTLLSGKEKTKLLYLKIRDSWRYTPYSLSFSKESFIASEISKKSKGHCVDKSIVLIACLRGLGIPARIHLAKV